MSIGSILNIARKAIATHQVAMTITSQNIANAQVEGYSRQRAEINAATPLKLPIYSIGTGVQVDGVIRMRNELLDTTFRREAGNREAASTRSDLLQEVESMLGEPSDGGLANSIDQFWNSWSDLSNSPGNTAAQSVVRQRGQQVAYTLNSYSTRLDDLTNRSRDRLIGVVGEINQLTSQFAAINQQITVAESGGHQAPDLRDLRDRLGDQLSKLAGVRVVPQTNGTVGVYIGSMMLVDASNARQLQVGSGSALSINIVGDPEPLAVVGGEAGELMRFVNTDLPPVKGSLNAFARGFVNGVNEYHASGWTPAGDALGASNWVPANGPTGSRVNFFDASFTAAGTIRLSAEVQANAAVIASGDVQNAPGNNNVAIALSTLRDRTGMAALQTRMGANFATQIGFVPGVSYGDHYGQTVTSVGIDTADAMNQFTVFDTLTQQADLRRTSVSGVSLDEELTLLMRHQQAYTAATRLVKVADEMAQAILNMT
ncbi:MAG: flagellar hook-associated protein FlgK [Gemmatimonadaceae bacterium]